ncbi:nucleic acid-binding protein [Aspergillus undulatus]|uniref:nucleic acid-binding protein n=1 Tax=Aspergillus undulatus TaxID=1810928 RepID=UPI003CCDA137
MYPLRRAACRLLASPAPLPVRSRLITLPSAYRLAIPRRTFAQSKWVRGEGKSPLDSNDEPATATNASATTTTETTTETNADTATDITTSTTTTEAASEETLDETVKVETEEVKSENLEGSLEDGSHSAATEASSSPPTEPGIEREVEAESENVQVFDQGSDTMERESTSHDGNVLVDPSNEVQSEQPRTIHDYENMRRTPKPLSEDEEFAADLAVDQIREAAAEERREMLKKMREERLELLRQARYEPKDTIFIGNLFYDVTAEDLREQMIKYGVVNGVNIIYDSRGISKGYAYVQFEDKEAAKRAIDAMHMRIYEGRRVTVYYAQTSMTRESRPKQPTNTLYIGNMPFEMTDRDLQDLFKDIAGTTDVRVTVDRQTGLLAGYVHAEFVNIEAAMIAREKLAKRTKYGKRLWVDYSNNTKTVQGFPVAV